MAELEYNGNHDRSHNYSFHPNLFSQFRLSSWFFIHEGFLEQHPCCRGNASTQNSSRVIATEMQGAGGDGDSSGSAGALSRSEVFACSADNFVLLLDVKSTKGSTFTTYGAWKSKFFYACSACLFFIPLICIVGHCCFWLLNYGLNLSLKYF